MSICLCENISLPFCLICVYILSNIIIGFPRRILSLNWRNSPVVNWCVEGECAYIGEKKANTAHRHHWGYYK